MRSHQMCCATFRPMRYGPVTLRWSTSRNASRVLAKRILAKLRAQSPPSKPSPSNRRQVGVLRFRPRHFEMVETRLNVVHIARSRSQHRERGMDELNGRMMACQILITGLIARVANESPDPLRFLTDFRDEIKAVVKGVNISGMDNTDRVRQVAQSYVDELFSLMKAPSSDEPLES